MNPNTQEMVIEFHKKFDMAIGDPCSINIDVDKRMRMDLIAEEYQELLFAIAGYKLNKITGGLVLLTKDEQILEIADALGDLEYVIHGAAIAWGLSMPDIVSEIHRSNMTKTPGNKREDGKVLKGPGYVPPDIRAALDAAAGDLKAAGYGDDSWWPEPQHTTRKRAETMGQPHERNCPDMDDSHVTCPEPVDFDDILTQDMSTDES